MSNDKRVHCVVEVEDSLLGPVYAELSAYAIKCDYGVARSPIWWELDEGSIEFEGIEIGEINYSWVELCKSFGLLLAREIVNNIFNMASSDLDDWVEEGDFN